MLDLNLDLARWNTSAILIHCGIAVYALSSTPQVSRPQGGIVLQHISWQIQIRSP